MQLTHRYHDSNITLQLSSAGRCFPIICYCDIHFLRLIRLGVMRLSGVIQCFQPAHMDINAGYWEGSSEGSGAGLSPEVQPRGDPQVNGMYGA